MCLIKDHMGHSLLLTQISQCALPTAGLSFVRRHQDQVLCNVQLIILIVTFSIQLRYLHLHQVALIVHDEGI